MKPLPTLLLVAGSIGICRAAAPRPAPAADSGVRDDAPASVEKPAPASSREEELRSLVAQLGDPDLKVREAASRRLRELGESALPVLKEALKHSDPEVCT